MPQPRKVDLLPDELQEWLKQELKDRGFGGYVELAEALNARLEGEGLEIRIGKSALHEYGKEFREYSKWQADAETEMKAFLTEATLADEIDITSALFQQLTTIAFRTQMAMASAEGLPDPRGLKDLTQALNNLTRSAELRDKIKADVNEKQSQQLDQAVSRGEIEAAAAQKAREIMGFV